MAEALTEAALQRRLKRANKKIAILEELTEEKTRTLYLAQQELRAKSEFLAGVLASMESAVILTDDSGRIVEVHGATARLAGIADEDLLEHTLSELLTVDDAPVGEPRELLGSGRQAELTSGGGTVPVLLDVSELGPGGLATFVVVATDISEIRRLEVELRHAQKLESVGRLAAGVAHEINTPIQFVGDSVNFVGEAVTDALELITHYRAFASSAAEVGDLAAGVETLAELEEELDIEFIEEEAPQAVERTKDGVRRVAEIVAAMKQFSHPGGGELAPLDLNDVVNTTLVVARNEYKYVAEVHTELAEIPPVMADRGDVGQVILNLIVNAAHAIADKLGDTGELGSITITTTPDGDGVRLSVTDTGGGVPAEIQDRIFDPFFTTKEPGRGTGQGLAITRTIIVDRHGGRIDLDVDPGIGSTFTLWLGCE